MATVKETYFEAVHRERDECSTRIRFLRGYEESSYANGLTVEHARDVCTRLMYAWESGLSAYKRTDPAKDGHKVKTIVDYSPGSDAFKALVKSTSSDTFYQWRAATDYWENQFLEDDED